MQHPSFPSSSPTIKLATTPNVIVYIFSLSDESEYELHDEEFEDKFSCDLKGLLQAKDRDKLFTVRDRTEKVREKIVTLIFPL